MTQLIVSLEDRNMLNKVKTAISMLRGVASVKVYNKENEPNTTTVQAMHEAESGDTILCDTMEDYLKLVDHDIQD